MIYDLAIVGAGTCGLFAAVNSHPLTTVVFDKNSGAKKLSITGNNKSNITNCMEKEDFLERYGKNGAFLRDSFKLFFKEELINFFERSGFDLTCRDNKVVLKDKISQEFAKMLLNKAKKSAASFREYEPVVDILKDKSMFILKTHKGRYYSKNVLLACGGKSFPATGSDGSCYNIAKKLGHSIVTPNPCEVPFCCKDVKNLQGLSFKNVNLTLKTEKRRFFECGDILFTHFGISGPAVLELSKNDFKQAKLLINFLGINEKELLELLTKKNRKIKNIVKDIMPKRFVDEMVKIDKYSKEASKKELKEVVDSLLGFEVDVEKCSFNRAFVTCGGVSLREINPKTMESKLTKGLFFCGEIMDIQGSIGGFNLQAAFSTSFCAVDSIKNNLYSTI